MNFKARNILPKCIDTQSTLAAWNNKRKKNLMQKTLDIFSTFIYYSLEWKGFSYSGFSFLLISGLLCYSVQMVNSGNFSLE